MFAKNLKNELRKYSSKERLEKNKYFFKTDEGCYSANDKFIGVSVPDNRKLCKKYMKLSFIEIGKLLKSEIHEERLSALIILSELGKKYRKEKERKKLKELAKFYLKNKEYINNWDLVDVSTHYVLGNYILEFPKERKILDELVVSDNLWDRRMAMVSTWIMIREDKIDEVFYLAKKLLDDKEDLIHKAIGWMLREAWKKDSERVESFIKTNYERIPRMTLRYSIEKIEKDKRKSFLKGVF